MTGFGRAQRTVGDGAIDGAGDEGGVVDATFDDSADDNAAPTGALVDRAVVIVEARSVNHKGIEVKLKAPRQLAHLEAAIIKAAKARCERGRVDIAVDVVMPKGAGAAAVIDQGRVKAIVGAARDAARVAGVDPQLTIGQLLSLPGVLIRGDDDGSAGVDVAVEAAVVAAATDAIDALVAARDDEGRALEGELGGRATAIAALVDAIAARTAVDVENKKLRLEERLALILGQFSDPARVAAETALLAERLDVTEELARLRMHLTQLGTLLSSAGSGRRLDFLCQEFLREANTTASKCQDATTAHLVVELKAEIERLREQAQNVE